MTTEKENPSWFGCNKRHLILNNRHKKGGTDKNRAAFFLIA
ncbi:hypothetical protein imdm_1979 [gamma proteobacterium IMCC2047]|nr:hypothetical protein imdm_1979 [gamma proteobacterium IMCC2047]